MAGGNNVILRRIVCQLVLMSFDLWSWTLLPVARTHMKYLQSETYYNTNRYNINIFFFCSDRLYTQLIIVNNKKWCCYRLYRRSYDLLFIHTYLIYLWCRIIFCALLYTPAYRYYTAVSHSHVFSLSSFSSLSSSSSSS